MGADPRSFVGLVGDLWRSMDKGGFSAAVRANTKRLRGAGRGEMARLVLGALRGPKLAGMLDVQERRAGLHQHLDVCVRVRQVHALRDVAEPGRVPQRVRERRDAPVDAALALSMPLPLAPTAPEAAIDAALRYGVVMPPVPRERWRYRRRSRSWTRRTRFSGAGSASCPHAARLIPPLGCGWPTAPRCP
jgi:hypothetical protein